MDGLQREQYDLRLLRQQDAGCYSAVQQLEGLAGNPYYVTWNRVNLGELVDLGHKED